MAREATHSRAASSRTAICNCCMTCGLLRYCFSASSGFCVCAAASAMRCSSTEASIWIPAVFTSSVMSKPICTRLRAGSTNGSRGGSAFASRAPMRRSMSICSSRMACSTSNCGSSSGLDSDSLSRMAERRRCFSVWANSRFMLSATSARRRSTPPSSMPKALQNSSFSSGSLGSSTFCRVAVNCAVLPASCGAP